MNDLNLISPWRDLGIHPWALCAPAAVGASDKGSLALRCPWPFFSPLPSGSSAASSSWKLSTQTVACLSPCGHISTLRG